jgi:HK97 gp10 family phage protein
MKGSIKLTGGEELERKLAELDKKVARKISSKAVRAGAKIILAEAKRRAPVGTDGKASSGKKHKAGTLKRSLKVRSAKKRNGTIRFQVQTKDGDYKGEAYYGAFVNYGHKTGSRKAIKRSKVGSLARSKGQRGRTKGVYQVSDTRRQIPGNPFMLAAFLAKKQQATDAITSTIQTGIAEAIGG